jgi:two-component system, OmpR family, sensor histidine kinase KdpD
MFEHEQEPTRGRLKVFLGYASGVGKSFRMLDEGRRRRERGQDVVAGALQPEIPDEIRALLSALEIVPTLDVGGVPVMDVPAILRRHPQVCLVDGLAYDNPEGSRNAHRWQDVEELLAAGITVVGSVNLQYIDDQREAVERIAGKQVTETIPRAFLNRADEIVIVDTPPSEASPELSALREMALLLSADVIDAGLQHYLQAHGIDAMWGTHEHFLVYLTPGADAARMLASALRNAQRFHCRVQAVSVKQAGLSDAERESLDDALGEARAAGARVDVLEGADPVETIVEYARAHGVTQIFVGQDRQRGWRTRWFGGPLNRLIRAARGMDVRVFPPLKDGGAA